MRILSNIEGAAAGQRVIVVANRAGALQQAMSPKDFQKALGHKIEFLIPQDDKAFKQAANNGKPLVQIDPRSKASKVLQNIVAKLNNEKKPAKSEDKAEKKSSWSQMFKKG